MSMSGEAFWTVMPKFLTSAGRARSARLTRFWTSTWAMSMLVPTAKVQVRK